MKKSNKSRPNQEGGVKYEGKLEKQNDEGS